MKSSPIMTLILSGLAIVGTCSAALVTDSSGFTSPLVIDFSQYAVCTNAGGPGCAPPLDVGGLVGQVVNFTATAGINGGSAFNGNFGLLQNGIWDSGRNGYAELNGVTGFLRFDFASGPVSAVGAFMNYGTPGLGSAVIRVLGAGDTILESYDLSTDAPISTGPGSFDAGAFRGITRGSADIIAVEFLDALITVDDLTFSPSASAVPEPASALLLIVGLTAIGCLRRRRAQ